jgi:drug/metabolite transporter (DMT)-like permease
MSPLLNSSPLFTALFAMAFLGERPGPWTAAGLGLILCGAVVVPFAGRASRAAPKRGGMARSTVLGLLSAVSIALYMGFGKQALRSSEPRFIVMVLNLAAFVTFASAGVFQAFRQPLAWRGWFSSREAVRATIVSGVLVYAVCAFLELTAMARIEAHLASALGSAGVVFGLVFGVALLRERPSIPRCLGALLIVAGCVVISLGTR